MLDDKETSRRIFFFLLWLRSLEKHCHLFFESFCFLYFTFCFFSLFWWWFCLFGNRWLTDAACTAWDAGKCPASSTRGSPLTAANLPQGRSCAPPAFIGRGYLMFLPLLLAGLPSVKSLIPMLIHQDPPPLWKTKPIPFHLPSPTADSRPLLTQIWVWHPRLVRRIHPVMFYFFLYVSWFVIFSCTLPCCKVIKIMSILCKNWHYISVWILEWSNFCQGVNVPCPCQIITSFWTPLWISFLLILAAWY